MVAIIPVIVSHSHGSPQVAAPSTTNIFQSARIVKTPSASPTNTSIVPNIHNPAVICGFVFAVITLLVFLITLLASICRACSSCVRQRRNIRQAAENPAEAQSRWYARMKSSSGSGSSDIQSPEVADDIRMGPIGDLFVPRPSVREDGATVAAALSTSAPSGQPPAYTAPTQPHRVFFNQGHNYPHATFDSSHTASTLPAYNRRHHN